MVSNKSNMTASFSLKKDIYHRRQRAVKMNKRIKKAIFLYKTTLYKCSVS